MYLALCQDAKSAKTLNLYVHVTNLMARCVQITQERKQYYIQDYHSLT